MKQTVIFVDDEEELRHATSQTLMLADIPAVVLDKAELALAQISRGFEGVLVTDIRMPGQDGLWLMRKVLELDPEFPVILVTGHGDVNLAVQSMREGAYDFIEKPFAPSRLVSTIHRALEKRRLTIENRALKREVGGRDKLEARLIGPLGRHGGAAQTNPHDCRHRRRCADYRGHGGGQGYDRPCAA